jgi:hypothetical protein
MKSISRLLAAAAISALAYPVSAAPLLSAFSQQAPVPPASIDAPETHRAPVILAQSGDPVFRIGQLEEQVRGLNGRIEELGFQLLQMQEQMRQMQQDNEFRFQELEKTGNQRGDAGPAVTQPGSSNRAPPRPPKADTQTLVRLRRIWAQSGSTTRATLSAASSSRRMAAAKRLRCLRLKTCTRPATITCWPAITRSPSRFSPTIWRAIRKPPGPRMQCSGWAKPVFARPLPGFGQDVSGRAQAVSPRRQGPRRPAQAGHVAGQARQSRDRLCDIARGADPLPGRFRSGSRQGQRRTAAGELLSSCQIPQSQTFRETPRHSRPHILSF